MRRSKGPNANSDTGAPRSLLITEMAGERRFVTWAFVISCICHLAVFGGLMATQKYQPKRPARMSAISVSLVASPVAKTVHPASAAVKKDTAPKEKASKKKETRKKAVAVAAKPVKKKPVVSTSGKAKISLKKKTFKPSKVKKNVLEDIEKKVEKESSERITSALDRIKAKVEEQEHERRPQTEETSPEQTGAATGQGTEGGGERVGELIDIYRVEIAYEIQKNWAFPDQLAEGRNDLQTMLVFKVMPNGEIRDVFFTDRSGNNNFDESAYRAIMKSNPVDPHPPGIIRPYVQMGLRFTPEGIK
ncbi:MAG: TonB family protein [Deltaproteobacteria bacterium]|nr:TonB family protein [Deltaproteobacteria bacterium]